jgi:hypothetical protein
MAIFGRVRRAGRGDVGPRAAARDAPIMSAFGVSPQEFMRGYHTIVVNDSKLGISAPINVTKYISGGTSAARSELGTVGGRIAGAYFGSSKWSVSDLIKQSQPFYIKGSKVISSDEPFTYGALQRAFLGRGSPDEMIDAVRLAVAVKRCKPNEVTAYAQKWFGSDCNAFVGNWLGVSPSTSISAYANGYGGGVPSGATPDVLVTKDIVHLPPITDAAKISEGSLVLTFGTPTKSSPSHWKHVALVQSIRPAGTNKYYLTLAEWGHEGNFESHMTRDKLVTLTDQRTLNWVDTSGAKPVDKESTLLGGAKCLAYKTTRFGKDVLCVFLDSSPLDWLSSRGWDIGGHYGT